ncbi:MAG: hypothetical protein ACOCWQ_05240 [Nanoarchaeota archaeon]
MKVPSFFTKPYVIATLATIIVVVVAVLVFRGGNPLTGRVVQEVDAQGAQLDADADLDGVVDLVDQCEETPAGESPNEDGCSCSQLDLGAYEQDQNPCTEVVCRDGQIFEEAFSGQLDEFVRCPSTICDGNELVTYPESNFSYCEDGEKVEWSCEELSREESDRCVTELVHQGRSGFARVVQTFAAGGGSGGSGPAQPDDDIDGVPEFSLGTMALAVVGVFVGMTLLRKA